MAPTHKKFTNRLRIHRKLQFGAYFSENDIGEATTAKDEHYRSITNFFWCKLNRMDVHNMWFHHKGVTANATMEILPLNSSYGSLHQ